MLQYLQAGLSPKSLKPELEPNIGNQNQEFFDNFYTKVKDILLILMKYIVKYCDDTIKETGALINSTDASLKQYMDKEEPRNIEEVALQMKKLQNATL